MFTIKQSGSERGDCTTPYDVILDREYTVIDFAQTILSGKDWFGTLNVIESKAERYRFTDTVLSLDYRSTVFFPLIVPDSVIEKIRESNLSDRKVTRVKADGGWGRIDFDIIIDPQ